MLHNWFEVKVKFEKTLESGNLKKVSELFLFDALTFTEAEARTIKEITPFSNGDFEVAAIKKAKVNELFFSEEGDKWYRCKVNFITLDEKSGAEKKTASVMMVQASTNAKAHEHLVKEMAGTLADYEVADVSETKILDVYPYEQAQD